MKNRGRISGFPDNDTGMPVHLRRARQVTAVVAGRFQDRVHLRSKRRRSDLGWRRGNSVRICTIQYREEIPLVNDTGGFALSLV